MKNVSRTIDQETLARKAEYLNRVANHHQQDQKSLVVIKTLVALCAWGQWGATHQILTTRTVVAGPLVAISCSKVSPNAP